MKRIGMVGLCAALLLGTAACGSDSDTAYNAGMTALQNQNYAKAYDLLLESEDPRAAEMLEKFAFVPVEERFVSTSNEQGNVTTYTYDDKGYLIKYETTEKGLVSPCEYLYDTDGNLLRVTEPDGVVEQYSYDANGNRVAKIRYQVDKELYREEYAYDEHNRRISQTTTDDSGTDEYRWEYDAAGNLIKSITWLSDGYWQEIAVRYDDKGNKIWAHNKDSRGMDNEMQYEYDAAGRCTLENYVGRGTVERTYDQQGRLTFQKTMQGSTTEYTYDGQGRLVLEKTTPASADSPIRETRTTYTYDEAGRVASETLVDGDTVLVGSYTYDQYGNRLTKRNNNGTWFSEYTYRWAVYYYPDGLPEPVEEYLARWKNNQSAL